VNAQGVGEVGKKEEGEGASVAAPTAGLHFTAGLLGALREQGVERAEVTLHVGTGTFRTVETEFVEQHRMHTERCSMDAGVVGEVLKRKAEGGRVICVGTTSARTVESYAREWAKDREQGAAQGGVLPGMLATDILITPGYSWRWTDGLMTNFHLPKSTLMAMVGSLLEDGQAGGGIDRLKRLYAVAIERGYRFYSYGDAMLILP
jgi:S-adenosylmethionine:tRNA ribosyltransferase-isomerase